MKLRIHSLEIADVLLLEPPVFHDRRGFLMEVHKGSTSGVAGIPGVFPQVNVSHSVRGVLRGLHYQHPPAAQAKLVHVIRGEIFDVAVDLRRGSPTFARWVGRILSERKAECLFIPPGFAHGYCTLAEEADVIYLMTSEYSSEHEAGLRWDDEELGIAWPIRAPVLSERDAKLPSLRQADIRFVYRRDDGPPVSAEERTA